MTFASKRHLTTDGVPLLPQVPHVKMTPPNIADEPTRRGARAAESACLESTCAGNGTVGSNPTLSAKFCFRKNWNSAPRGEADQRAILN